MWVETEMSEPNDERWTLDNDLGLDVNLMQRSIASGHVFDGWNYRIGETVGKLPEMSTDEAKEQVIRHLKVRIKMLLAKI